MKNIIRVAQLLIASALVAFPVFVSAQSTVVSGNLERVDELFAPDAEADGGDVNIIESQLDAPLVLQGRIKEVGRFRTVLRTQKLLKGIQQGNIVALQGRSYLRKKVEALTTATLVLNEDGGYRIVLDIVDEGKVRNKVKRAFRLVRLTLDLKIVDGEWKIVQKRLKRGFKRPDFSGHCGAPLPSDVPENLDVYTDDTNVSASYKVVSVIIEGDLQYQSAIGNVSSDLTSMMNFIDTIYKRDLGVAFDITVVSDAQNYTSKIEYDEFDYTYPMHDEMRSKRPASSRSQYIHYAVTGKTPEANSNGLAGVVPDLATICTSKENSIGFTIRYDYGGDETYNYETTAHEIGHLFAAEHDDNTTGATGYIMNSGTNDVDDYVSEFSSMSKTQVAAHTASNSSCLSTGEGNGGGSGGGEEGGGEEGTPKGGESEGSVYVFTKRKKRPNRIVIKATYNEDGSKASFMPAEILCGYSTDDVTESYWSLTLNRKGRKVRRYKRRQVPTYCKVVVYNEDYSTVLGESEALKVGRGF